MFSCGVCLLAVAFVAGAAADVPSFAKRTDVTYRVEHNIDSTWQDRGSVTIDFGVSRGVGRVEFDEVSLDIADWSQQDLYKVRLREADAEGHDLLPFASIPMCEFLSAPSKERFRIHTDAYAQVIALEYHVKGADCSRAVHQAQAKLSPLGVVSVGNAGVDILQAEEELTRDKNVQQEQPWYKRYWWAILLVVVYLLASSAQGK